MHHPASQTRLSIELAAQRRSRPQRFFRSVAALGLLAGVASGTSGFENNGNPVGLQGIFSAEVPADLTAEGLAALDGNWEQWSKDTAAAIQDVYQKLGSADLAAQRAGIATLKSKLAVVDKALEDPRYASLNVPLTDVHGGLSRRIDLAEAVLATLELDGPAVYAKQVEKKAQAVSGSISGLEAYLATISGGSAWIPYAKIDAAKAALAKSATEGATIEALKTTHAKLAKRSELTDDTQKEFLGRPAFVKVEQAIEAYLKVAETPYNPETATALRASLAELVAAVEDVQAAGTSGSDAKTRESFSKVRTQSPDGGDLIAAALQKHFFNYNLRFSATETFLSRLLSDARVEQGAVNDYVLGAAVGGNQTTTTSLDVDMKPSASGLKFDLVLNGTVQSSTAGATPDATIYTSGYHTFRAAKPLSFDGDRFTTGPATIGVNASNTTTGASTRFSGGLLGGFAERIAVREATARRPESEAIAASRIQQQVLPRFNNEVNTEFNKVNETLDKELFAGLKSKGLFPDARALQSTETDVRVSTRLMGATELGGGDPRYVFTPAGTAAVMIHQSLINNSLARMGLAGQTLTEDELSDKIASFLSEAFDRKVEFPKKPAKPAADGESDDAGITTFMFAKEDPIRIRVSDGVVYITLKSGFRREGKDDVPELSVTVPLQFTLKGQEILVELPEPVMVEGSAGLATRKEISRRVERGIPEKPLTAVVDIQGAKKTVQAVITQLKLADGWIALSVR